MSLTKLDDEEKEFVKIGASLGGPKDDKYYKSLAEKFPMSPGKVELIEDPIVTPAPEEDLKLLSVTTKGFENGVLQHNMPCAICLENPALYVNDGREHYFAPCENCAAKGYCIKRKWWGI